MATLNCTICVTPSVSPAAEAIKYEGTFPTRANYWRCSHKFLMKLIPALVFKMTMVHIVINLLWLRARLTI